MAFWNRSKSVDEQEHEEIRQKLESEEFELV